MPPPPYDLQARTAPRNGLGTASLVLGLVAVFATVSLIGLVFGIAAVVGIAAVATGVGALARVRRGAASNRAPAVLGIVLGGLSILVTVGVFVWLAANGGGP
jgi:hypothetical protein